MVAFTISEDQPKIIRSQRILELKQSQDLYRWGVLEGYEDLPGFFDVSLLDKIPQERNVFEEVKERFNKRKTQASKLFRLSTLLNTKVSWYSFDDLKKIFVRLPGGVPKISEQDQWMDDVVFGWQFLNGCNPNFIKRCEVLPKNFPVTEEMVKDFLDRGKSLENEMKVYYEFLKRKQFLQVNAP